ncbi:MAG TPA: amino acid permease [Terriglobales bacterium]|jgi:APA family basic amino acid/polyamine antiporter|nr:amino acid permease [Terriglobales bacterium]
MPETASKPQGLLRELGVSHAVAIVVGTVIGSGIFRVPGTMMRDVGSAKVVYLAWIVGGLLSFFGALTYSELGAMKPQAGGEYVYVRDGYGPMLGFLYAWTWFVIAKPASIATITTGLTDALSSLPRLSFLSHPAAAHLTLTWAQLVAIGATILISFLNYVGVRRAGAFQLIATLLKVAMLVGIAVIGFSYRGGSWANFATRFTGAHGGFNGFMLALVAALWAYDGWNDLNMVAGEIRRPERDIPIALIAGVAIVAALYMLMYAAVQYVLPADALGASKSPASAMALVVLGTAGAALITAGIALSMLVTLNGTVMSGGRIPYAVARDGYFFQSLAAVSPRFHTPSNALLIQAVLSILLLLIAATFKQLLDLAIFAEWLFYMIAASTIFVFRKREPDAARPYKAWGYPLVPALFILSAGFLLYYTFKDNLETTFIPAWPHTWINSLAVAGVVLIAAGVPVYFGFARKKLAADARR